MSLQADLSAVERNVQRSYYEDGFLDLVAGLLFLVLSGGALSSGKTLGLMPIWLILMKVVLDRLKQRHTYPRTGYVRFVEEDPGNAARVALSFVLLALVVLVVVLVVTGDIRDAQRWYRWTPLFSGIMVIGAYGYLASRSGSRRYYAMGLLTLAGAVWLCFRQFPGKLQGLGLLWLLMSAMFLLSGTVSFARFARAYPLAAAGAAEADPTGVAGSAEESGSAEGRRNEHK
jgi:hypothetical protein